MAEWKRPIRNLFRRFRHWHLVPKISLFAVWYTKLGLEGFMGILLSMIPGLAHLIFGQFRSIRIWIVVWATLLFLTLFFYGGFLGFIFLGFTIGAHAWIACHAGFFTKHKNIQTRIIAVIVVAVGLYLLYHFVGRILMSDIVGAYSGVTVPYHRIQVGDYVLSRRSLVETGQVTRGSLMVVNLRSVVQGNIVHNRRTDDVVQVCEVIALPGEKLEIQKGCFYVNDKELDPEKYPIPTWLLNCRISTTIPMDSYFIIAEFRGRRFGSDEVIRACTISIRQIEAKAILRWYPIWRRGWIREPE
jgi:hypothetical protein